MDPRLADMDPAELFTRCSCRRRRSRVFCRSGCRGNGVATIERETLSRA